MTIRQRATDAVAMSAAAVLAAVTITVAATVWSLSVAGSAIERHLTHKKYMKGE
jgi:hypothetical protein